MNTLREDQIDFERVVTDPEYRRHVIVYLNAQAGRRESGRASSYVKTYRAEFAGYPALRRIG